VTSESPFPRRPDYQTLAAYMAGTVSGEVASTARYVLIDCLAGALTALDDPACRLRLGPTVGGAILPGGARVPGTAYELEPVQAVFNLASLFVWQNNQAQWLGAEPVFPGDTLGAILAMADWASRQALREGRQPLRLGQVLAIWIKATEMLGCLVESGDNSPHAARLAIIAAITALLGGSQAEIECAMRRVECGLGHADCEFEAR